MTTSSAPKPTTARRRLTDKKRRTARRLYETTELTQVEIAARIGIAPPSLSRMAKLAGWTRPTIERAELARRVRLRIDAEIAAAEAIIDGAPRDREGAETVDKAARALASLLRTLREIGKFDEEQAGVDDDDDAAPRDIEQLRATLAERLDRMRAGGS